ncbi:hypothetical protein [Acidocella sp.]|uniref:hypothetical protein n=1 Tax=Acidocella sp. TaxID=50710 RepID=UPI00260180B1|nr:hypothetical protein [Acidocella sp.]
MPGCTAATWQPAAAPQSPPAPAAAVIRNAETQSYWSGFAAGRRLQKREDAQAMAVAVPAPPPAPAPATSPASVPASVATPTPAPPLLQPAPIPPDAYAAKGPARPVPIPGD